jgi:2-C-methyl-D-erythritol 4-phosphate cytidylyltransferase
MNTVIVVAGGSGKRMGGPVPKQDMSIGGKPMIIHTLERFLEYDPEMRQVLVISIYHGKYWNKIAEEYFPGQEIAVVSGGSTRFDSVKNGLQKIEEDCIVGIHDAVRPLVSRDTIERCYQSAIETGSGIPVVEMDDSVRLVRSDRSEPVNRSTLRRVQTPQVFRSSLIKEAYRQASAPSFTDDAMVFESLFGRVSLVEGNPENIKITRPSDFRLASMIL